VVRPSALCLRPERRIDTPYAACAHLPLPLPLLVRRDPQRLEGELLLFMDVCGRLLGEIRS
jgi:hypothetical protein